MRERFGSFERPLSIERESSSFIERPIKQVVPLPAEIRWPDGSKLIATRLEEKIIVPLEALTKGEVLGSPVSYTYQVIYKSPEGKEITLNDLFESKVPIVIIGGDSFFAMDYSYLENPEDRKIIISLDPKLLKKNKLHLLAVFHELGHSFLYQEMDLLLMKILTSSPEEVKKILENPQYKGITVYLKRALQVLLQEIRRIREAESKTLREKEILDILEKASKESDFFKLRRLFYDLRNYWIDFDKILMVFHERMAWAFALKVIRKRKIGLLKTTQEIFDYIDDCLRSHERVRGVPFRHRSNLKKRSRKI